MLKSRLENVFIGNRCYRTRIIKFELLTPDAVIYWIELQLKMFFTYPKASRMKDPYWNGYQWVDISDIPF